MKINKKLNRWYCSTIVYSYSHKLKRPVLDEWNHKIGSKLDSPINLNFISERKFLLNFFLPEGVSLKYVNIRSYMLASVFLISLNVGNPGSHIWRKPAVFSHEIAIKEIKSNIELVPSYTIFSDRKYPENLFLDRESLIRAERVFAASTTLKERFFFNYIKGMNLLSIYSTNADFYEEIFLNFWKSIEILIATFRGGKVKANVKTLLNFYNQQLPNFLEGEMKREFISLYRIRGNTISHSLSKRKKVGFEEAMKVKLFADVLIYKTLKKKFLLKKELYKNGQ